MAVPGTGITIPLGNAVVAAIVAALLTALNLQGILRSATGPNRFLWQAAAMAAVACLLLVVSAPAAITLDRHRLTATALLAFLFATIFAAIWIYAYPSLLRTLEATGAQALTRVPQPWLQRRREVCVAIGAAPIALVLTAVFWPKPPYTILIANIYGGGDPPKAFSDRLHRVEAYHHIATRWLHTDVFSYGEATTILNQEHADALIFGEPRNISGKPTTISLSYVRSDHQADAQSLYIPNDIPMDEQLPLLVELQVEAILVDRNLRNGSSNAIDTVYIMDRLSKTYDDTTDRLIAHAVHYAWLLPGLPYRSSPDTHTVHSVSHADSTRRHDASAFCLRVGEQFSRNGRHIARFGDRSAVEVCHQQDTAMSFVTEHCGSACHD